MQTVIVNNNTHSLGQIVDTRNRVQQHIERQRVGFHCLLIRAYEEISGAKCHRLNAMYASDKGNEVRHITYLELATDRTHCN